MNKQFSVMSTIQELCTRTVELFAFPETHPLEANRQPSSQGYLFPPQSFERIAGTVSLSIKLEAVVPSSNAYPQNGAKLIGQQLVLAGKLGGAGNDERQVLADAVQQFFQLVQLQKYGGHYSTANAPGHSADENRVRRMALERIVYDYAFPLQLETSLK